MQTQQPIASRRRRRHLYERYGKDKENGVCASFQNLSTADAE